MEALLETKAYAMEVGKQLEMAQNGTPETRKSMSSKLQKRLLRLRWAQTRAFSFLEERAVTADDLERCKMISEMLRDGEGVVVTARHPHDPMPTEFERRRALERIGKVLFEHADDLRLAGFTRSVLWDRGSFQFVITGGKAVGIEYPHGEDGGRGGRSIGPHWRVLVGSGASTVTLLRHLLGALYTNDALLDARGDGDFFRKGRPLRRWWWEANESFDALQDLANAARRSQEGA